MSATDARLQRELLGSGLIAPLQRISGNDFAWSDGEALVASSIRQILMTRPGELPWRPDFGVDLEQYRHRGATEVMASALANEISEAIARFEPRVSISSVTASVDDNVIQVKLTWAVITEATEGNNVLLGPISQEVSI